MFPDSEIAKKITCCPTKASSLSVFGLAPYFQGNPVAQLDEVPFKTCCPTKGSSLSVFGLAPYFQGNPVAQLDEVPFKTCCPTKASSLSVFGLAPYFQGNPVAQLDEVPFYSISFDESYNKITKNEQMDFSVWFCNNEKIIIVNRYFGFKFFGHGTASDLLDHFKVGTSKFQLKKITQISMDGPNVNLKFYRDFLVERQNFQPDIPIPIDIGFCGLHIIHGAFKTGFDETGWKIDNILRSLWYLFNDSPARIADYTDITSSMIFPLKF